MQWIITTHMTMTITTVNPKRSTIMLSPSLLTGKSLSHLNMCRKQRYSIINITTLVQPWRAEKINSKLMKTKKNCPHRTSESHNSSAPRRKTPRKKIKKSHNKSPIMIEKISRAYRKGFWMKKNKKPACSLSGLETGVNNRRGEELNVSSYTTHWRSFPYLKNCCSTKKGQGSKKKEPATSRSSGCSKKGGESGKK